MQTLKKNESNTSTSIFFFLDLLGNARCNPFIHGGERLHTIGTACIFGEEGWLPCNYFFCKFSDSAKHAWCRQMKIENQYCSCILVGGDI